MGATPDSVRSGSSASASATTRVVAELELAMTVNNGRDLIVVRSYGAEIAAENDSVAASVQALDSALSDIFTRFVADADAQRQAQSAAAN